MVFTVNSETIENEHVQITENPDGDLEIVDKTSGESVTLGAEGVSARAIDADEAHVGNHTSRITNEVVNLAEYDTLQAAVDAVPRGGELYIPRGFHPVSQIGTAETTERLTVRGAGAGLSDGTAMGSIITVDTQLTEPVLRMAPTNARDTQLPTVSDIGCYVTYGSPGDVLDFPIIELHDAYMGKLNRCYFNMASRNATAVRTTGAAFSCQLTGCRVARGTGTVVSFEDTGGGAILRDCLLSGSDPATGEPTVYYGTGSDMQIDGGQITAKSTGTAVEVDGVEGGYIRTRFESVGIAVQIDGTERAQDINIDSCQFTTVDDVAVEFGNALACTLSAPARFNNGTTSGVAARWTADSAHCQVSGPFRRLQSRNWTIDVSAFHPTVQFDPLPRIDSVQRDAVSAPVEGMTIYNTDTGAIESYNGTGWGSS